MSAKLKELQAKLEAEQAAMEQELSSTGGGNGSGDAVRKDTAIEVDMRPSGRTALDPEGEEQAERKSLLRRKKHEQAVETARLSPGKIAAIVGVGVVVALLLLLLLFSNDSEGEMESTQPLTLTQLKRERPQNACPDPWWIPEKCQGEERIKSRTVWDECQAFFDKFEYNIKYLKKCGIDIMEGKVPKNTKG
mmetsp:Transcript_5694/g.16248  ORF Transcript_5694/g.16248 Transcript_5694/m.16248 type:complete len:192 (+) Transcript_5694:246-821(+)|eukprot:CAMPEP_0206140300 /NCGR_PEP_ID=MMETSP1473-20131121/8984_1 /ASSEMBLY_ACC=CAM_ASM_001109 /TAXON_ID=1461547 /ORGANISM="Stichococcus sp, Strain RCC1054" /LENGTH=191 /DNA_ID=CAMNT_0053534403 /DNA_START=226 /DNA_END=801 /DNA_ORIENTATION=-